MSQKNSSTIYKGLSTVQPRHVKTPGKTPGSFVREMDGQHHILFDVEMDWPALYDVANKARSNKSKVSRVGPLTIRVKKVKTTDKNGSKVEHGDQGSTRRSGPAACSGDSLGVVG